MCQSAPDALEGAFKEAGLAHVVHRPFVPRLRRELTEKAQKWQWQFFTGVMPAVMLKLRRATTEAEAADKAEEVLQGVRSFFADGEFCDTRFGVVVGQKR